MELSTAARPTAATDTDMTDADVAGVLPDVPPTLADAGLEESPSKRRKPVRQQPFSLKLGGQPSSQHTQACCSSRRVGAKRAVTSRQNRGLSTRSHDTAKAPASCTKSQPIATESQREPTRECSQEIAPTALERYYGPQRQR